LKEKFGVSARVGAGVFLVCLSSFLSIGSLLKEVLSFDPHNVGSDKVSIYEKRFAALKKILPARGVMGYISNREIGVGGDEIQESSRYLQTQYALAPLIVLRSPNQRLVIGNFQKVVVDSQTCREWNVEVLAKFDGVFWLHNRNVP